MRFIPSTYIRNFARGTLHSAALFVFLFMFVATSATAQETQTSTIEKDLPKIEISINKETKTWYVMNAEGLELVVYSLTGSPVHTQHVHGGNQPIDLPSGLPKGIYVVKVGDYSRKIYVP